MSAWSGSYGRGAAVDRRKQKRAEAVARQRQHDDLVREGRLSVADKRGRWLRHLPLEVTPVEATATPRRRRRATSQGAQ